MKIKDKIAAALGVSKKDNLLSKHDIQIVDDVQIEIVQVPEWGGSVLVQSLGGKQRDEYTQSTVVGKGKNAQVDLTNMTAKLVALCMVNEKGERLFNNLEVNELAQKSAAALTRVYKVAARLSGIDEDALDELVKNSESNQSDDSGSD